MNTSISQKSKVKKYYGYINLSELFHNSLLDVIEALLEKHEELVEQGFICNEIAYSEGDDNISLYAYREETDEEVEKRIDNLKFSQEEELALYKQLKAKYGKLTDNDDATTIEE